MRWPSLFRPAWQHQNPERRREAVETQELEAAQLRQLVVSDPDRSVQLAAVAQLVRRNETATLEGLSKELPPEHPAREGVQAYLLAHSLKQWKRELSPSAKLDLLRSLPVAGLLPYIPLVDSAEQAAVIEQRLTTEPQVEMVRAVLTAPAFPAAVKDRLVHSLSKEVLASLQSSTLSKKTRQLVEHLLNKDSIAEARAREIAGELTSMFDRLTSALAEPSDEHPKHLRGKFSLAAWTALDPAGQHPSASAYRGALASLEQRIAAVESTERQIDELMESALAASAESAMAAFETRLAELEAQLPKAVARNVQQRREVVRMAVARAAEQRRTEAQEQAAAEAREQAAVEREQQKRQREQQRAQEAEEGEQRRARQKDRELETTRSLQQQFDDLMTRAKALQAPELRGRDRASRLRSLRAQWKNLQGPGVAALKQAHEEEFRAALAAAEELSQEAEEEDEWRRWALLNNLDKMTARAQALLAQENVVEVAAVLKALRLEWVELSRQGVGKDAAQRAKAFQEAWDRAFERVQAAQEQCLAALTALTSAEKAPTSAEVKVIQDAFRALDVPAGPQQRAVEVAFRRAVDGFFAQRRQQHEEQNKAREANLEARRGLIAEAERVLADQAARDQGSRLIELQRRWKEIGPVPREHAESTWTQFRALCQTFFDKQREERTQAVVEREGISKELQAILETLGDDAAFEPRTADVEALIARWQSAVVAPAQREPLESAFRELTKRFYDGVRRSQEEKRSAASSAASKALARKLELVEEAELLAESAASPDALARLQEIERVWAELPSAAKAQEALLVERLRTASAHYAKVAAGTADSSADLTTNLAKKREVCGKLAILHKLWNPKAASFGFDVGDLGRQLQLALTLKQVVDVPGDVEATRRRILREVGKAVGEWEAAGAVAEEQRPVLVKQFQQMMRGFVE